MREIALITQRPDDRIALRGVRIKSAVAGMSQKTTVEQTFINLETRPIEAIYTFPLPDNAAVCGFEVVTGDRVLTGVIDDNDKAIETYDDAINRGHGAFLMEQHRADVFSVRVGNLKPQQAATIRLTYVAQLDRVDKQIRLCFPTTVAPRYITSSGTDPVDAAIDGDALNPPQVLSVPYGLNLEVEIDLGRAVGGVYSTSHSIGVERKSDRKSTVTLRGTGSEMNRDVVLLIDLPREHEPSVQIERGDDGANYLAVTFVPEFDESSLGEAQPCETIFVLDCSGSMMGTSIAQATAALELCLRSLNPGDSFNIIKFGSRFESLSSEPLMYGEPTLERALAYVRAQADLGGTELLAPLAHVFVQPIRRGQQRQVILLTDGQVSNEPAVLDLARSHRALNRIFTFGIGSACSASLIRGLARATGGAAEFISEGERLDEKVLRTFSRLASPRLEDLTLDWGGSDVQTLAEIPPVFDGDVMTVFGRCSGRPPERVTLRGKLGGETKSWSVRTGDLQDGAGEARGSISLMWARRMIQSLEDVNGIHGVSRAAKPSRERATLIDLSKRFGLLCSLTTFVAIEHRNVEDRTHGVPETRRVPVMLAEGWGGLMPRDVDNCVAMAVAAAPASGSSVSKSGRRPGMIARLRSSISSFESDSLVGAHDVQREFRSARSFDPMQAMLALQSADGWFEESDAGERAAAGRENEINVWAGRAKSSADRGHVAATLKALLAMHHEFKDRSDLWQRAADKAYRWLARATGAKVDEIRKFVES